MGRYVLKRILLLIPVLLGVSFIIFTIMAVQKGNPGRLILGAEATEEAVQMLNERLGVNRPFFVRYFSYLGNLLKGDMGNSYRTSQPVFNDIKSRIPVSFMIALDSIVLAVIVGVPLGILSAVKQYSFIDTVSTVFAMLIAAIPAFWSAMMLVLVFSLKLGWLPSSGVSSWKNFILPMISLAIPYTGTMLRMTRSSMLETIRADYVRTAKAKGVPQRKVIFKHALQNALLPIITVIISSFGGLLGGAIITESVYSMPGLGTMIILGIRQRDTPAVMGATIPLAFMFGVIMLVADLLYAFVDPRIKAKYTK
jgi:peptide/nickel transport system permease protein